jgi:8-oxo-(d)GTP phosphatase
MALLVVRHANAGRRSTYKGDDRLRPLSSRGQARSAALVKTLSDYRPNRILSSPFTRCFETVQPLATALSLPIEPTVALAEGHGGEAVDLVEGMAGESAVLCTHGDVAAVLLDRLVPDLEAERRAGLKLQKGDVWVVQPTGPWLGIVDHLRRDRGGSV